MRGNQLIEFKSVALGREAKGQFPEGTGGTDSVGAIGGMARRGDRAGECLPPRIDRTGSGCREARAQHPGVAPEAQRPRVAAGQPKEGNCTHEPFVGGGSADIAKFEAELDGMEFAGAALED